MNISYHWQVVVRMWNQQEERLLKVSEEEVCILVNSVFHILFDDACAYQFHSRLITNIFYDMGIQAPKVQGNVLQTANLLYLLTAECKAVLFHE